MLALFQVIGIENYGRGVSTMRPKRDEKCLEAGRLLPKITGINDHALLAIKHIGRFPAEHSVLPVNRA